MISRQLPYAVTFWPFRPVFGIYALYSASTPLPELYQETMQKKQWIQQQQQQQQQQQEVMSNNTLRGESSKLQDHVFVCSFW